MALVIDAADSLNAINAVQQALAGMSTAVDAVVVKGAALNKSGAATRVTLEVLTTAGQSLDLSLKRVASGGFAVISRAAKQSTDELKKYREEVAKTQQSPGAARRANQAGSLVPNKVFDFSQLDGNALESARVKLAQIQDLLRQGATKADFGAGLRAFRQDLGPLTGDAEKFRRALVAIGQQFDAARKGPKAQADALRADRLGAALQGRTFDFSKLDSASLESARAKVSQIQELIRSGASGADFGAGLKAFRQNLGPLSGDAEKFRRALVGIGQQFDALNKAGSPKAQADARRAGQIGSFVQNKQFDFSALEGPSLESARSKVARIQELLSGGATNVDFGAGLRAFRQDLGPLTGDAEKFRHLLVGIGQEFEKTGQQASLFAKLAQAGFVLVVAHTFLEAVRTAAGLLHDAASAAGEFERSVALIQTITSDSGVSTERWSEGIIKVSNLLGEPVADVAAATYEALSNQVAKGADAFELIAKTGEFARTVNASLPDSLNLVSSAFNAFQIPVEDADRVLASFFSTIDLGRVKVADIQGIFGRTGFTARSLGLSLDDLNASLSTITRQGIESATSQTLLANVLQKLLNPTKELQDLYDKLGVKTGDALTKTYGYAGALQKLKEAAGGSRAKLTEHFNEIRGFQGADILTDRLAEVKRDLQAHANAAPSFDLAKLVTGEQSFGQKFKVELNAISNAFLTDFQQPILKAVGEVLDAVGGISNVYRKTIGILISATPSAVAGITALALALNFTSVTAALAAGIGQVIVALDVLKAASVAAFTTPVGAAVLLTVAVAELARQTILARQEFKETESVAAHAALAIGEAFRSSYNKSFLDDRHALEPLLKGQQQAALQDLAKITIAFDQLGEAQKRVAKDVAEAVKEQFSTLTDAIRGSVNELEHLRDKHHANASKSREDRRELVDTARDKLFDQRNRVNDVNRQNALDRGLNPLDVHRHYNLREAALYTQRRSELRQRSAQALADHKRDPNGGGLDRYRELAKERLNLLYDQAGQTFQYHDPFTGRNVTAFKFKGVQQEINKVLKEELEIDRKIEAVEKSREAAAAGRLNAEKSRLKAAEAAGKKIVEFDPFDKKGRLDATRFKGVDDVLKKFDELVKEHEGATSGFGDSDNRLATFRGFAEQRKALRDALVDQRGSLRDRVIHRAREEDQENTRNNLVNNDPILGEFDERVKRAQAANAALDEVASHVRASYLTLARNREDAERTPEAHLLGKFTGLDTSTESERALGTASESFTAALRKGSTAEDVARARADFQKYRDAVTRYDRFRGLDPNAPGGSLGRVLVPASEGSPARDEGGVKIPATPPSPPRTVGDELNKVQGLLDTLGKARQARQGAEGDVNSLLAGSKELPGIITQAGKGIDGLKQAVATFRESGGKDIAALNALLDDLSQKAAAASRSFEALGHPVSALGDQGPAEKFVAPEAHASGGIVGHFAGGGFLHDFARGAFARGTDTVPVMAAPGEVVVNARSASRFATQLRAINSGRAPDGDAPQQAGGDVHVHVGGITVQGSADARQTADMVVAQINRNLRRGTSTLKR